MNDLALQKIPPLTRDWQDPGLSFGPDLLHVADPQAAALSCMAARFAGLLSCHLDFDEDEEDD